MADQEIRILKDGNAKPHPCTLSKSGQGYPKRVVWFADDKEHDIPVIFKDGISPLTNKNRIIKGGGGGPEHTDDIDPKAEVRPGYYYTATPPKAGEVAADPEIIIKN